MTFFSQAELSCFQCCSPKCQVIPMLYFGHVFHMACVRIKHDYELFGHIMIPCFVS